MDEIRIVRNGKKMNFQKFSDKFFPVNHIKSILNRKTNDTNGNVYLEGIQP